MIAPVVSKHVLRRQRGAFGIASGLGLALAHALSAQQAPYGLSALADSARQRLPSLRSKEAVMSSARAAVTDARHAILPQIRLSQQVNLGTTNALPGLYFPLGSIPSTTSGVRSSNQSDLASGTASVIYGEFELFDFGLRGARIHNAEANLGLERADLAQQEYLVEADVARLYFRLARAQSRVAVEQQNVDRFDNAYRVIRALTASGVRAEADSSLARAELSRAQLSLNQANGALAQLTAQLAALTGIAAERLRVDTTVMRYPRSNDSTVAAPPPGSHPLLGYFREQENLRRSAEQLAGKGYLPKVLLAASAWGRGSSIGFDDTYRGLNTGLDLQRFNYGIGVALSYDVSNVFHRTDRLAVNHYLTEAAKQDLAQRRLNLETALTEARDAVRTAESNLAELPIQLEAARATYQQRLAQYQAGIIGLVDLTNAAFVLYRSQGDILEGVTDWYLARVDQAAADGSLDAFIHGVR